jgi:hypothetical protein
MDTVLLRRHGRIAARADDVHRGGDAWERKLVILGHTVGAEAVVVDVASTMLIDAGEISHGVLSLPLPPAMRAFRDRRQDRTGKGREPLRQ